MHTHLTGTDLGAVRVVTAVHRVEALGHEVLSGYEGQVAQEHQPLWTWPTSQCLSHAKLKQS